MTVIFKAKTNSAYIIKILAELLQNNIKTACFEIDDSGIKLCMMDHHRTILIQVSLESENFTLYKFKSKEKLFLGINLNHFHKMLKYTLLCHIMWLDFIISTITYSINYLHYRINKVYKFKYRIP